MAPLSLATNCISLFLAYTLVTLHRVNCSDALVFGTSGKLLSSSKIIPHSSIAIPQAALKSERYAWQAPGCHRIGITRWIKIPGCIKFSITTNACRGYCLSYSVPSGSETLNINPKQVITSVGQCCNIMETEDIIKSDVLCHDGSDSNEDENWIAQEVVFKSALSCGCLSCKKD